MQFQSVGILALDLRNIDFKSDQIMNIIFTKFNSDNLLDLGLSLRSLDEGFSEFVVYDAANNEKLDSFSGSQSFSDTQNIYFIEDFGGDGKPDLFFVQTKAILRVAFETIFFWQQNLELTVVFILCILGFAFAITILLQWRKALRSVPLTDDASRLELQQETHQEFEKKKDKNTKRKRPPLFKTLSVLIITLAALTVPMILFLRLESIGLPMQAANVRLVHILTFIFLVFFSLIPVVAVLYNIAGPIFATSIYLKTQAQFIKAQPGKHDYRVLVLDYGFRQKRSTVSYLTRSLFPILLAMAVGVNSFLTFNTAGSFAGFSGSTQMQEWILNFEIWCSLPIILTFALASFLVPSAWLLDDAGVVYFVENLQFREPGDVSKISEWLLRYIKAIAGFTALLSYFNLFGTTNFIVIMDDMLMSVFMTMDVFAFIVLFPFLGGFVYMLVAQITVENNLTALKQKLYQRMNAMGIDTTPRQLRDVLDPKDRAPRELEKVWKKVKIPHKEKRNADSAAMNPSP